MFIKLMVLCFLSLQAFGEKKDLRLIKEAFDSYWSSELVSMDVERENTYSLLDKTETSKGKMYFSKGQLRLNMHDPKPSHLVIGEDVIWFAEKSDFEKDKWVVVKVAKDKAKRAQAFFNLLFGNTGVTKKLELIGNNKVKDFESYILKPKNASEFPGVTKLAIIFHQKTKEVMFLQYWDDLENKTSYELTNIERKEKSDKSLFKYTPPKNSDVTVY
ncbi:MAG: outer membrane lipoprotein carrier protein LolA [Bdellovibrionales bacterium]|nr:outer membrane lipoprotein carrier protein LolA [Bdellovibrionales bacterium]